MPTPQRAYTELANFEMAPFFEFGYVSSLFSDSSLLGSFPNQLTHLDNPAFSLLT